MGRIPIPHCQFTLGTPMWNPTLAKEKRGERCSLAWLTVLCSQHCLRQRKRGLRCWARACSAPPGTGKGLPELKAAPAHQAWEETTALGSCPTSRVMEWSQRLSCAKGEIREGLKEASLVWFYCRVENS